MSVHDKAGAGLESLLDGNCSGSSSSNTDSGSDIDASSVTLPPEIIALILAHLRPHDLCTALRANSVLCSLALPLLYRRVSLSSSGPWPVFDNEKDETEWSMCDNTPLRPPRTPSPRPAFLSRASLGRHVQHLDVSAHATGVCASGGLLHWWHGLPPLPSLHVLRLTLDTTWSGARVFHTNVGAHDHDSHPERICAALVHVRAPKLVVRRLTLAHSTLPRHEIPAALTEGVRHYVAVFEPDHPFLLPRNGERSAWQRGVLFRNCLPRLAGKVTVIFHPPGPRHAWRSEGTLSWELIFTHARCLMENLASWAAQRGAAVEVVNPAALLREGSDAVALHESVRQIFRTEMSVLTMEEWLDRDEWRDVFDEHEVMPWLDPASDATAYPPPMREYPDLPHPPSLHVPVPLATA